MLTYVTELLGTFLFVLIFLKSNENKAIQPFLISIGLMAARAFGASVSGGHFNPALTMVAHRIGKDSRVKTRTDVMAYVGAQVLGGLLAYEVFKMMHPERE